MPAFRKKPVVIQAWRFVYEKLKFESPTPAWLIDAGKFWPSAGGIAFELNHPEGPRCLIATLEGEMVASQGDWIIKGIHGELYPCKPDIFFETYHKVAEGSVVNVASSEPCLDFVTFSQIVDEMTDRHRSGIIIISKGGGMEVGEWGDDHDKLGLMQIAMDTIMCRNRGKYYEGTNEDA